MLNTDFVSFTLGHVLCLGGGSRINSGSCPVSCSHPASSLAINTCSFSPADFAFAHDFQLRLFSCLLDSQFHAAPFPALTLQLLTVTGSLLIQLCLLNTSATCLPFFLHVFCSFQIWTSASLLLLSFCFLKIMKVLSVATTYSSLVLLFLQSSSWLLYLKFRTVNPKRKSCSASNLFSPRAYRLHNIMDLTSGLIFLTMLLCGITHENV